MPEIVVTEANDDDRVALRVDDALTVRLEESPTTGYRWTLATTDNKALELAADTFTPASGAGVGGGGVRTFRFLAKKQGNARLQFKLAREWQPSAATKVFTLSVTVG